MKVLTPGHSYELENFEHPLSPGQRIQFIERVPAQIAKFKGQLVTVHDGTTDGEVLKMLIDRLKHLSGKLPCRETSLAVTKCEEALMWIDRRTQDRKERNVEGTLEE